MGSSKIVTLLHCYIVTLLIFLSASPVFAQREMDDYFYQYEKYRDFHKNYLKARDSYLTYQTLTAREELIRATSEFLPSRSIVIRTYLQALKYQLKQAQNVVGEEKRNLILELDKEVSWLLDNEEQIKNLSDPTLDDLLEISARVERQEDTFKRLAYQTLANILLGKMRSLQSESVAINFLLADKIAKNGQEKNLVTLSQWLETVKDFTYRSQKHIETAEDYLLSLKKSKEKEVFNFYSEIQEELNQARLDLSEAATYQKEILREVEGD